jgi:uncharacterized damage-inducible protein DinB
MSTPEPWLRGPVAGVPAVLQPAAHALLQAQEDIALHARDLSVDLLWRQAGAATAGFHALHLAGALDRLYTYARGETLSEAQRAALKAELVPHPELGATELIARVDEAIARAIDQLRATPAERVLDERKVGRAGLPSTVLGLLFHGAEHSTRHSGQFITTLKLLGGQS